MSLCFGYGSQGAKPALSEAKKRKNLVDGVVKKKEKKKKEKTEQSSRELAEDIIPRDMKFIHSCMHAYT